MGRIWGEMYNGRNGEVFLSSKREKFKEDLQTCFSFVTVFLSSSTSRMRCRSPSACCRIACNSDRATYMR